MQSSTVGSALLAAEGPCRALSQAGLGKTRTDLDHVVDVERCSDGQRPAIDVIGDERFNIATERMSEIQVAVHGDVEGSPSCCGSHLPDQPKHVISLDKLLVPRLEIDAVGVFCSDKGGCHRAGPDHDRRRRSRHGDSG